MVPHEVQGDSIEHIVPEEKEDIPDVQILKTTPATSNFNFEQSIDAGQPNSSFKASHSVTTAVKIAYTSADEAHQQARAAKTIALRTASSNKTTRKNPIIGVYIGQINDAEKAEGLGVATNAEGHTFKGDWENGLPEGRGVYTFKNGSEYAGSVSAGQLHGNGVLTLNNGASLYAGEWEKNQIHGYGQQYSVSGNVTHAGKFVQNKAVLSEI